MKAKQMFYLAAIAASLPARLSAQQGNSDSYQYSVTSTPPGAAVYVGRSYKGKTPYTSAWVSAVPKVTYTLVKGGYETKSLTIQGRLGQNAKAEIALTASRKVTMEQAGKIMEAVRHELKKVGAKREIEGGFPNTGPYLTEEFQNRIARAMRAAAATGEELGMVFPLVEDVIWIPQGIMKAEADSISFETGISDAEIIGAGYVEIITFSFVDDAWKISGFQKVGQDFGDDDN